MSINLNNNNKNVMKPSRVSYHHCHCYVIVKTSLQFILFLPLSFPLVDLCSHRPSVDLQCERSLKVYSPVWDKIYWFRIIQKCLDYLRRNALTIQGDLLGLLLVICLWRIEKLLNRTCKKQNSVVHIGRFDDLPFFPFGQKKLSL